MFKQIRSNFYLFFLFSFAQTNTSCYVTPRNLALYALSGIAIYKTLQNKKTTKLFKKLFNSIKKSMEDFEIPPGLIAGALFGTFEAIAYKTLCKDLRKL